MIASSNDPTFLAVGNPSINTGGTVAFWAIRKAGAGGGDGIFTGAGGATTALALSADPTFSSLGTAPAINAGGTVVFQATRDAGAGGGSGIFTVAGGTTTALALSTDPTFSGFGDPSINTAGTVAFSATLDAGGSGLYLGNGGAGTRVIGTGDALFGSTVSSLLFGNTGLNDAGQLAFRYTLASGTTGIAVATVPEPTSALLLATSAAALLLRRRRG